MGEKSHAWHGRYFLARRPLRTKPFAPLSQSKCHRRPCAESHLAQSILQNHLAADLESRLPWRIRVPMHISWARDDRFVGNCVVRGDLGGAASLPAVKLCLGFPTPSVTLIMPVFYPPSSLPLTGASSNDRSTSSRRSPNVGGHVPFCRDRPGGKRRAR
jgi:hypothetical protein